MGQILVDDRIVAVPDGALVVRHSSASTRPTDKPFRRPRSIRSGRRHGKVFPQLLHSIGMEIRIGEGASDEEARVIGSALAEHTGTAIEVYVGDGDAPATTAEPPASDDRSATN